MTYLYERFQTHCRWCFEVKEADSIEEAIRAVEAHEAKCPKSPAVKCACQEAACPSK